MHSSHMPKTLMREINKNRCIIHAYHFEPDVFGGPGRGEWSVWIDLKPGYKCSLSDTGCIHEATARDAIDALKGVKVDR
jgi:hypothetical protein